MAPAYAAPFWSSVAEVGESDFQALVDAGIYWQEFLGRYADGRRWCTKSPVWATSLPGLLGQIQPDAVVVHLHRDPAEFAPSAMSMLEATRRSYDPDAIWSDGEYTALQGLNIPTDRDVDVGFKSLVVDPVGTMMGLYEDLEPLGLVWSAELADRIDRYAKERAKRVHYYAYDEYAREVLADYVEQNEEYL
jgi:hypothetical protein